MQASAAAAAHEGGYGLKRSSAAKWQQRDDLDECPLVWGGVKLPGVVAADELLAAYAQVEAPRGRRSASFGFVLEVAPGGRVLVLPRPWEFPSSPHDIFAYTAATVSVRVSARVGLLAAQE